MPANSVYSIYQDSKGFIWMAHDNGLTRYDGTRFKSYATTDMSSRAGSCVMEDLTGRIWYENFDGYIFYVENDTMYALQQEVPHGFLNFTLSEKWMCRLSNDHVDFYDLQSLKTVSRIDKLSNFWTSSAYLNGDFYFLGEKLIVYNPKTGAKEVELEKRNTGYNLMCKFDQGLLIASRYNHNRQLLIYENGKIKRLPFELNTQVQAVSAAGDYFWFSTTAGVYVTDKQGHLLNDGAPYFKEYNITSVFKDKEDNYWFTTAGSGVLLVHDMQSKVVFSDLHVTNITAGNGVLYVATFKNQLYKLESKYAKPELFYQGKSTHPIEMAEYIASSNKLFFVNDYFRYVDSQNRVETSIIGAVKDVCEISRDVIGFSATGACGYFLLDKKTRDVFRTVQGNVDYKVPTDSKYLIVNVRAKTVEYDPLRKRLYFGTGAGLIMVDTLGHKQNLLHKNKVIYPQRMIKTRDSVFVLDINGSLYRIEDDKLVTSQLFGKVDEPIKNIKVFNDTVIALTDHLLLWRVPNSPSINEMPVLGNEVTDFTLFRGDLCMVAANGIRLIPLEKAHANAYVPKLQLIELIVNGATIDKRKLTRLNYLENNIEIDFALPGYSPMASRNVCYSINDGAWISLGADARILRLPAMAPGEYTVRLAMGFPGKLLDNPIELPISINPPWYKSWWGTLIWLLLLIGIISTYYIIQTRLILRRNKLAKEKDALENELRHSMHTAIKSQMNPHFFHNALNTIQSFIYSDDKKRASTYLTKFSRLSRMILEMSDKDNVRLSEELEAMELYLDIERVRFNEELAYHIQVDKSIQPDVITIPSMIIQPYIENALKHGLMHKKGEKLLSIQIKPNGNVLEIVITDNGVGRERAEIINKSRQSKHISFATKATEKRLSLLNKSGQSHVGVQYTDKKDLNGHPIGTSVRITVPLRTTT